mmetsp:Transcript_30537/g.69890  ORF Transcript_30537/g.69890 Transcript_30537/m.69890 type:complete len:383 (-) Transcript_30537:342-1490(-)
MQKVKELNNVIEAIKDEINEAEEEEKCIKLSLIRVMNDYDGLEQTFYNSKNMFVQTLKLYETELRRTLKKQKEENDTFSATISRLETLSKEESDAKNGLVSQLKDLEKKLEENELVIMKYENEIKALQSKNSFLEDLTFVKLCSSKKQNETCELAVKLKKSHKKTGIGVGSAGTVKSKSGCLDLLYSGLDLKTSLDRTKVHYSESAEKPYNLESMLEMHSRETTPAHLNSSKSPDNNVRNELEQSKLKKYKRKKSFSFRNIFRKKQSSKKYSEDISSKYSSEGSSISNEKRGEDEINETSSESSRIKTSAFSLTKLDRIADFDQENVDGSITVATVEVSCVPGNDTGGKHSPLEREMFNKLETMRVLAHLASMEKMKMIEAS